MKDFWKTNRRVGGQGIVEFALALPLLLLLVIGALEVGRLMFIYGSVTTAAREAVRYASAVGVNDGGLQHFQDCNGIREAAKSVGFLQGFDDEDIHITYDRGIDEVDKAPIPIPLPGGGEIDPDPSEDSCPLADAGILENSDLVVVQVSLMYAPIIPFIPLNPFEIKAASARTVIVDVAIEVTAAPQGWSPDETPSPTSAATRTSTSTATQTPTATLTPLSTPTQVSTATKKIPPGQLNSVQEPTSIPTYFPTASPTITPIPSCASIRVIDARFNGDKFEVQVQNDNVAPAYLINSTLDWDTTYAPTMYFNEAWFGVRYYTTDQVTSPLSMPAPSLRINGGGATQLWQADFNNPDVNWQDGYYGVTLIFAFPNWGNCTLSGVKTLYTPTPSNTPTVTPTYTPTSTPTASATAVNCTLVTHGDLKPSGNTLQMSITNGTGAALTASQVTISWNHNDGHHTGNDKTLRLQSVSLGSAVWTGDVYAPSYTVTPYSPTIPTGTSTIIFTFHQSYDDPDYTERVLILLSNNGCQNYSIDSSN